MNKKIDAAVNFIENIETKGINEFIYIKNIWDVIINQKEYTIDDILEKKGLSKREANEKIKEEITKVQQKVITLIRLFLTTKKEIQLTFIS